MSDLYLFKASIRGNIKHSDEDALQTEIMEQLANVPYFTLTDSAVQVWVMGEGERYTCKGDNGETLYQYTISLSGNIYAEDEAAVRAIISAFCAAYPAFVLTYRRVKATGIKYQEEEVKSSEETEEEETAEEEVTTEEIVTEPSEETTEEETEV